MRESLGSVTEYIVADINIKLGLPKKKPFCQYCEFCIGRRNGIERAYCLLTDEILPDFEVKLGNKCPGNGKWKEDTN